MKPTKGQIVLAANAEHGTQCGKTVTVYVPGHTLIVTACTADKNDDGEIEFLNCLDSNENEVLIDLTQVLAIKIAEPSSGPFIL